MHLVISEGMTHHHPSHDERRHNFALRRLHDLLHQRVHGRDTPETASEVTARIYHELDGLTLEQIKAKARLVRHHCDLDNLSEDQRLEFAVYVWLALDRSLSLSPEEKERMLAAWLNSVGMDAHQFAADVATIIIHAEERAVRRGVSSRQRLDHLRSLASDIGPSRLSGDWQ